MSVSLSVYVSLSVCFSLYVYVSQCVCDCLTALENDHEYLLKGDVFTQDVIDTWISYKIENEIQPLELRPHPWEFAMYYDL